MQSKPGGLFKYLGYFLANDEPAWGTQRRSPQAAEATESADFSAKRARFSAALKKRAKQ